MAADSRRRDGCNRPKKSSSLLPRLQRFASKGLTEVTQRLLGLVEEFKSERLTTELRDVVYVLKAQKLRSATNAHAFHAAGGVGALLQLLSRCKEGEGRDLVLLLGTIGNLCALERETRATVSECVCGLYDTCNVCN